MPQKIKFTYGADPHSNGDSAFYWDSPQKRTEYYRAKSINPAITAAIYDCQPGSLQGSIFLGEDFRYYTPQKSMALGRAGIPDFLERGELILQAWDTAFSSAKSADYSVGITGIGVKCESAHDLEIPDVVLHYDIYILDVFRERLDYGDLENAIYRFYSKWLPAEIVVEKRASGQSILTSQLNQRGIRLVPADTNSSKRARAQNGTQYGSAQGWVQLHRVFFPREAPWLEDFERELRNFDGSGVGEDDQVDAFVHLINRFLIIGGETPQISGMDESIFKPEVPKNPLEELIEEKQEYDTPQFCYSCKNFCNKYCSLHKMPTLALNSCPEWEQKDQNA